MTSISKNVYIDKLDDIVNEYNNTYQELQKINQQEFKIEKVIKKKGDKLYVQWKGYDSSFNSWIDKKT